MDVSPYRETCLIKLVIQLTQPLSRRRKVMRTHCGGHQLLLTMSNDGLGLPRELQVIELSCRMGLGRQRHLLCLLAYLLGGSPRGEDTPALSKHMSNRGSSDHERESATLSPSHRFRLVLPLLASLRPRLWTDTA